MVVGGDEAVVRNGWIVSGSEFGRPEIVDKKTKQKMNVKGGVWMGDIGSG